jgi:branched-chain amino acid transport system ATP-binding protein
MSTPLLQLDGVRAFYKRSVLALDGVSLQVDEGQIVALLGANGAGKTTTLRAISGSLGKDDVWVGAGSVRFDGQAIENQPPHLIARQGLALVPEREKIFPNLTVRENLGVPVFPAGRRSQRASALALAFKVFPALEELQSRVAGLLSGGERQMLAIASAMVSSPRLLMIDELSLGLSPLATSDMLRGVRTIRDELGIAILLVEQNATAALAVADHGYVLEHGRVVLQGTSAELRTGNAVQSIYLGLGTS